ncbi:hypothetical protein SAMN06265379_106185 [Saccharicrinis carchari]|uniref:CarboxypepD_reg-like domain-containing protein n=1 Tax=Saccharicrinis carchari TaxID=1168039 RepID=A0A521DU77_SACCC|nr:carboxypeptidase-like regulatory domain-containing protein [Saccharicrinis carchari]SMO75264.1 hypothetical protein SAMN06265379_106185 [Saccharicrinis carchari]
MKPKRILPLLLLVFCTFASAQVNRDSLLFRGVILEGDSLFSLPYAKYIVNNKFGYTANEAGQFSFWAKPGDMVHFSYVGFKPLYLQLNDTLSNSNYLMGVFLSRDTIELSEVIIIPQFINPNAVARNMPMLSTTDEVVAQNNVAMSTYQAKTQPVTTWDAEMNQKNFIQSRSNDIAYQTQVQPSQMVGVSNTAILKQIDRAKLRKMKPARPYITQNEWEQLLMSYQQRIKNKLEGN